MTIKLNIFITIYAILKIIVIRIIYIILISFLNIFINIIVIINVYIAYVYRYNISIEKNKLFFIYNCTYTYYNAYILQYKI